MGPNLSKTVATGGIQDSQEGLDYQWKSLTLFAIRCFALQHQVKSFAVFTEIQEAEKFDDVVLEYTDQHNDVKYILAQAKHRKTSKVLDSNSLIADDNFSLLKYFASFWEISQKFGAQEIESVMIITNNILAGSKQGLKAGRVLTKKIHQSSESLYFEKTDHFIFGSIGEIFKFVDQNSDKREKVFEIVRIIILSYELASLSIKKPKSDFLSRNQKYLFETIIDQDSLTIKQDFLGGTLISFEFFSQMFGQALKVAGEKNFTNLTIPDIIARIQNHFQDIFDKTIEKSVLITNQKVVDDTIDAFLNKLLYVTKLKTEDLQNEINSQLREIFKQGDIDDISAKIELRLRSWLMHRKNKELIKSKFEEFIIEIAKSLKLITEKDELIRDELVFSSILPQVKCFINSLTINQPRVLRLETSEDETHFAAMRIVSNSNSSDDLLFLKASFTDEEFKQVAILFEKLSCYKLLVIELQKDSFKVFHENGLEKILRNDPAKKVVVIGDASLKVNIQSMQTLQENESHFTDLTAQSQERILDEKIRFQDQETTWRAVLNGHDLSKITLKDIVKYQELGSDIKVSKPYSDKIYIPRMILYNNCLNSSILQQNNQGSNDVFVFNKNEFEKQRLSQVPHHLLLRSGNKLEWIESTRDLSIILKHIDESNPKSNTENELAKSHAHITIVSDVAGMGKSSLFGKLAEAFKVNGRSFWIYKLDLNDHSEALDELTRIGLRSPEEAVEFVGEKIMKFESDFETNHFARSCTETGKVILLIDGVDEIFSSYGEEVVQMMKLLSQTKIKKIFISTRPECCERLEKEFLQIKHSLEPFSESDQKKYFLEFLKNNGKLKDLTDIELEKIVEAFLESMKRSIRDKDYKHTGVPLVTKLIAEYLEGKFSPANKTTLDKTVKRLKLEKFNLWDLYQSHVTKSFDIYFRDKCGMEVKRAINKRRIDQEKRKILENYKIYAIQQFLKKDAAKFFSNFACKIFSDFEMEEMVTVGLIYETDDGYKFVHQTFAENLFTLHLMENFEQTEVTEFIVKFVFIEDRFQVIRSFIEHWIEDKMSPATFDIYFEVFLSEGPKAQHTTPIHVSSKEKNLKILDFIYKCLTKNSKFNDKKSKIENIFFTCDKKEVPAIVSLITWSENLSRILDSVKNDFDSEFVLDIFRFDFKPGNYYLNLLLYNTENLLHFLKWMRLNLNDLKFFKEQIVSVREIDNCGILHFAFQCLSNQSLLNLLDEIKCWEDVLGKDLIQNLILMEDIYKEFFIYKYCVNKNFDTDFLIDFLLKIKTNFENDDESFLSKIIFKIDQWNQIFLIFYCKFSKNFDLLKFLKWFHDLFGLHNLEQLLLHKDDNRQTFIFQYFSNEHNSISSGLQVLNYLKFDLNFDENFLKREIIMPSNIRNENIFQIVFLRSDNFEQFNDFIEFQFKISDSELKLSLTGSKIDIPKTTYYNPPCPFLFHIAQKSEEDQEKYLNFLRSKFGDDIMNELISDDKLYNICSQSHRFVDFGTKVLKFFDFVEHTFGIEILRKLIGFKYKEQTFLFPLYKVDDKNFMKILNYLFEKFGSQKKFLEELLVSLNKDGNSFLIYYFLQNCVYQILKVFSEFSESIKKHFDLNFLKKLLLIKNEKNQNFHRAMLLNKQFGGVEKSLQVLEHLLKIVKDDQEFFIELTKQCDEIPEEIKEFLQSNDSI